MKDPNDKYKWVVDENVKGVIQEIFRLCIQGYGPSQIADEPTVRKALTPKAYSDSIGIKNPARRINSPYKWNPRTVADILEKEEYLGHVINFRTQSKSYKSKKSIQRPKEDWVYFRNVHEAIIDEDTFKIVKNIRNRKRGRTPLGEMGMLSEMMYCEDCGKKLYQVRRKDWSHDKEYFVCSTYRKRGKHNCESYQIRNIVVEKNYFKKLEKLNHLLKKMNRSFLI